MQNGCLAVWALIFTPAYIFFDSDGVSRVGVFCAVSTCMERILAQSEVDVFRAVEVVKQNRPQLVNDLVNLQWSIWSLAKRS